jgi:hypothetical protein
MTTDSAIVDNLKSLHSDRLHPFGFLDCSGQSVAGCVIENPVNPVTGLTPTCVRD